MQQGPKQTERERRKQRQTESTHHPTPCSRCQGAKTTDLEALFIAVEAALSNLYAVTTKTSG